MTHQEINHIKQSAPQIEEVIGRYVQLTRKGKSLLGLCPFHEDHHPSLVVNQEKQYFTCFACGEKGDVIHFLQKIEGLSFKEAVKKLKIENGTLKIKSEVKPGVKLTNPVCETEKFSIFQFSIFQLKKTFSFFRLSFLPLPEIRT